MAIIKKTRSNKCWRECGENGTFTHLQIGAAAVENSMEVSQKNKNKKSYDSVSYFSFVFSLT